MSKWTDEEIRELCVWAAPGPWESNYAGDVLTQSGGQIADFVPAVLEKRIDRVSGADCATGYDCKKCWHAWLEQEVQA